MILIRHGQTLFNVVYGQTRQDPGIVDPGLTEVGRQQVADAAPDLDGRGARRILASPYRRALETAEIPAEVLALPITVDPQVGERAHFACDIGSAPSELATRWPDIAFDHLAEQWWPTLSESEEAMAQRCQAFRERARAWPDWPEILIVSHWGFIRGLTGESVTNAQHLAYDPEADQLL